MNKLEQLKADYAAKWAEMLKFTDPFSKEAVDAKLECFRIDKLITAEIAEAAKAERDAKIAELRNARVALVDQLLVAYEAYLKAKTAEDKKITSDELAKAKEVVTNELLAKFTASAPAKSADGTVKTPGTKGANTAAIRTLIVPMFEAKMTGADIRKNVIKEHGFNDGTANAVILAYEKEIGLK